MFQIEYRNLYGEIILEDLINLTILKLKYNTFYTFLQNYSYILTRKDYGLTLYDSKRDEDNGHKLFLHVIKI